MGFWVFMLLMDLLVPVVMIRYGYGFSQSAPGKINAVFGYRTKMSMKNRDTWEFAHHYFGKLWFICGLAAAPVSVILMLPVMGKDIEVVSIWGLVVCVLQAILMVTPMYFTERALKNTFDENGNRK